MLTESNGDRANEEGSVQPDRKEQLVEVCIFFLFFIATSVALSFFIVGQGGLKFTSVAISVVLQNLLLLSLIVFFIRRNGEPMSSIGWTSKNVRDDITLGVWLFVPFFFGIGLLQSVLQAIGLTAPSTLPRFLIPDNAGEYGLAFVLILVVAFAEEFIFRGYLIRRFEAATGSLVAAVALSSTIFAFGHGYEGSAGVVATGVMGLIFAIIYIRRRSLVAPFVMHFLQNFIGIFVTVLVQSGVIEG